jgi:parallel beta-helix repeat protein
METKDGSNGGEKMKKTVATALVLLLLVANMLCVSVRAQPPLPTIYIKEDGSVDPPTSPIQRDGEVYTFTGDAFARLNIQRGNIVIDGAGYTLRGPYNGTATDIWIIGQGPDQPTNGTLVPWVIGIDMGHAEVNGVVIKNLNVKNFSIGMYIWTHNNTVTGNAVSENIVGVLLSGSDNTITQNYIGNNDMGIFFGVNQPGDEPLNIVLTHNSFVDNGVHFSGCFCQGYNTIEAVHTWDDGKEGNFWSDYNGTDADGDGVGDTPYVIDVQNRDRYPLMQISATQPTATLKMPVETIAVAIGLLTLVVVAVIAYRRKKKNGENESAA